MDLAQDGVRRLSILDLPEDVLRNIFGHFRNDGLYFSKGEIDYSYNVAHEDENFRTVQNARLVCRLFCEFASPLLVPVLRARISSESLDRVDKITRNPQIAAGVRLVQVVLEYRPREIAQNVLHYRNLQYHKVEQICDRCEHYTDYISGAKANADDMLKIRNAIAVYSEMMVAWDACSDPGDLNFGLQSDDEGSKSRELLYQCYKEYRHKHEDQYRLLTDGSFVGSLAASISRMASLRALTFFDHFKLPLDDLFDMSVTVLATDPGKLHEILVMPQDWISIEDMAPIPELLPAKLLWELPIAIYESGKQLRELGIAAFPTKSNFDMLCPNNLNGSQPAWDRLQEALRYLERVDVGGGGNMRWLYQRLKHVPPDDQAHIDKYLSALLSSRCLERIDLGLRPLRINFGRPQTISAEGRMYPIGSVLSSMCSPGLRCLHLSEVSVPQEELEKLFSGLGDKLQSIVFYNVGVLDGGWGRPLDVLRERLLSRRSHIKCSVSFIWLRGGGFDLVPGNDTDSDSEVSDDDDNETRLLRYNAEKYVSGVEGMVNPLAKLEARLRY